MRIALRRPAVALTLTFAVAAAVPVSAGAITRARSASAFRTQKAADTYVNVDAGKAAAAMRGSSASAVHVSRASRSARAGLVHSLGRQGVFQVDPLTGTPRVLARLDGSLTGPANGDAADLAMRYVRDNLAALGLDAADVAGLRLASRVTSPGGLTVLRWTQEYRGIPSIDHDLRVAVAADGRIISVWGSPAHALSVASVAPGLDALGAARKLQANVHGARAPQVSGAAAGARRATRFRGGDFARLVLFGQGASAHLAWHLTYRRDVNAAFDAVVDADTGQILRRANLVDHASSGLAWDNYPGATFGGAAAGTQQTVDLTMTLSAKDAERQVTRARTRHPRFRR